MESYWDLIKRIITESDLVLEILDARLVELSRNEQVEKLIKEVGRPVIFVVNKSDLVDRDDLKEQVEKLKRDGDVVFISAKKKGDVKVLLFAIKRTFKKFGKRERIERRRFDPKPEYREAFGDIVVGVLGYPNVGKSSIIKMLAPGKKLKISKKSGTTHGVHWINGKSGIKLIDSPGVIPLAREDEIRYGLIGAKDNEALKNPELVAHAVVKLFYKMGYEKFYNVNISDDVDKVIEDIGLKKGFLIKGGRVDENRVFSMIIRDWQEGRLRL